jgi:hypothetical protein
MKKENESFFIFRNSRAEKANQNGAPNLKSSKF